MKDQLQTARSRFPRNEYQLIRDSSPRVLRGLSSARLESRIHHCERLIEGYKSRLFRKTSTTHFWKKSGGLSSDRLIRYRMSHLESCLKKFRSELKRNGPKVVASTNLDSRIMTDQPKMKISRRGPHSGVKQIREKQRRQSAQENSVNPSSRMR